MTTNSERRSVCAHCKKVFSQPFRPGRPRKYCGNQCRRAGGSTRPHSAATLPRSDHDKQLRRMAASLRDRAAREFGRIAVGRSPGEDPTGTLREMADLREEFDDLVAALVYEARDKSVRWQAISEATGVSRRTASARWSPARVERRLRQRESRLVPPGSAPPGSAPLPTPRLAAEDAPHFVCVRAVGIAAAPSPPIRPDLGPAAPPWTPRPLTAPPVHPVGWN